LITYTIRIPGIGKQTWLTEITQVEEGNCFIDEQRSGPFKFWHHLHYLEEMDNHTKSLDRVTYILPFGQAGRLLHRFWIKATLNRIFDYREEKLHQLFPVPPPAD
jgi:ligand-binding SRPBCC domain-containing protein